MSWDAWGLMIATALSAGTVLAWAGLGLLINERAGVVNLGAEGMLLLSALTGFVVVHQTGSDALGFLAAAACGALLAAGLGVLVVLAGSNAYASGLAVGLFASGFSAFAGRDCTSWRLPDRPVFHWAWFEGIPFLGAALSRLHPMVFASALLALALGLALKRTRLGLVWRAVGDSPEAAHALGHPVLRLRMLALAAGGACCGVAGAYVSLVSTPLWVEGLIAGKGWIALALTTFATWRPARVLLGAWLFGGVTMLQFHWQSLGTSLGVALPSQALSALPYLATIVVLVLISSRPGFVRANMPASLGRPFRPQG